MSETTRIIGVPIPDKTDWKRILKYSAFSVLIIGMLGFGLFYLTVGHHDRNEDNLVLPTKDLPVADIPGSEAELTVDDSPGCVTLSDKDFALIVDKAANH